MHTCACTEYIKTIVILRKCPLFFFSLLDEFCLVSGAFKSLKITFVTVHSLSHEIGHLHILMLKYKNAVNAYFFNFN